MLLHKGTARETNTLVLELVIYAAHLVGALVLSDLWGSHKRQILSEHLCMVCLQQQPLCCTASLLVPYLLSQNEHIGVSRHLLVHRGVQGISDREL